MSQSPFIYPSGSGRTHCEGEEVGSAHRRHSLVGDDQRDVVAAPAELLEQLEGVVARACAHDAVALAELAAQVPRDRGEHGGLVMQVLPPPSDHS